MKKFILGILVLFVSCTMDEEFSSEAKDKLKVKFGVANLPKDYVLEDYPQEDQLKIIFAEAFSKTLDNPLFKKSFIENQLVVNSQPVEFLYHKNKGLFIDSTNKTFEQLILENVKTDKEREKLLNFLETTLPNLVIKIPDWTQVIFQENGFKELDYDVYVHTNVKLQKDTDFFEGENIPIQIKESEKLIPLKKDTNLTLWNTDFYEHYFPLLKGCEEFNRDDYTVFYDEKYQYIDLVKLNEDLVFGKLCSINLNEYEYSPDVASLYFCGNKKYERDCGREKNVIEGLELANNAVYLGISNQPKGEDVISLHYTFLSSQMCGDLSVSKDCPPISWKFVFMGTFSDFFVT